WRGARLRGEARAARCTFAGGSHQIVAVGGGAVADQFAIDPGAPRLGMLEFLEHDHPRPAGDHESVPPGIECAGSGMRPVIEAAGHRAHRIEQDRKCPVEVLAATGKDDVLLAHQDLLVAAADAMVRGGAGGTDGIIDALDLEPGGERRRRGRTHCLRHREGTDPLRSLFARGQCRFDDGAGRRSARTHDDSGPLVGNLVRLEAGIANGLIHGDMIPGGAAAMKAHGATVDHGFHVDVGSAVNLAAKPDLGIFLCPDDAGPALAKRGQDFLAVVADRGYDPHTGYRYSSHAHSSPPSGGLLPEQTDPQVTGLVYGLAILLQPTV